MLIIYAHPNKLGHCGEILGQVEKILKDRKTDYEILDLYEMNYDPVLKPEEHYTSGHCEVSAQNKEIQKKFKENNQFIFIYPTWWNSAPAILKGFVDRVFVQNFSFTFKTRFFPRGLLKGKALVFTSTGAPRILTKLYYKDQPIKFLTRDVLRFCGIRSKAYVVDRATKFNEKQKNKITKIVNRGLKYMA